MCTITTQTLRNLLKASPTQQLASQHHSLPKKTASLAEAAFDVAQGASYCVKAAGICKLPQCKAEKGRDSGNSRTPTIVATSYMCGIDANSARGLEAH